MRVFLRSAALIFPAVLILIVVFATVMPAPASRMVAYNGHCGIMLGGTCMADLNTDISVHRASYGTFVSEWSADMRVSAFVSPVDYVIYTHSWQQNNVQALTQAGNVRTFAPAISSDGTRVAYVLTMPNSPSLHLRSVNRDGTDNRHLTTLNVANARFSGDLIWSPD
ncbi:MAG: hypothetical protein AAF787_19740, partial [Chloroflexota bacterium]